jgi:hypothetical protein
VPVEGALQVFRHRVLGRIEGDPKDLRALPPAEDLDPSQFLAEGDLRGVIIDVQAAKDQGTVSFEHLEGPGRQGLIVEEPVHIDPDHFRPHGRTEPFGGDHCHWHSISSRPC